MDNKLIISPQVINTMDQSNAPWAIKDKNSCHIYVNQACKRLLNISCSFDFEGLYDHELPWDGAEFAKEYIDHDQKVMEKEERVCLLITHTFGKEQILSSYFLKNTLFITKTEAVWEQYIMAGKLRISHSPGYFMENCPLILCSSHRPISLLNGNGMLFFSCYTNIPVNKSVEC